MPRKKIQPMAHPRLRHDTADSPPSTSSAAIKQRGQRVQERTRGERWTKMRVLYLQQYPLCDYCDREGRARLAEEVDHILPLSQGGTDAFENLQGLCKPCHAAKTADEHPARRDKPVIGLDGWPQEPPERRTSHDPDTDDGEAVWPAAAR